MKSLEGTLVGLIGWALVPVVAQAIPFTATIGDGDGLGGIPSGVAVDVSTQVSFTPGIFTVSPIDQLALDLAAQTFGGQPTQSVPEPTTLALVGAGFVGMALMWWKRRGARP
jgi:hypothetical protein